MNEHVNNRCPLFFCAHALFIPGCLECRQIKTFIKLLCMYLIFLMHTYFLLISLFTLCVCVFLILCLSLWVEGTAGRRRELKEDSISLFSCVWCDGGFHSESGDLNHRPYSLTPVRRTYRFRSFISIRFFKTHIHLIRTHGCKKVIKVVPFSTQHGLVYSLWTAELST